MATKEAVKGFFAGVEGDQSAGTPSLLPTKEKYGAPKGNKWLMHFKEDGLEIKETKDDEHPYLSYQAEVDEPADYSGRQVFGMFFFPRPVSGTDADEQEKYQSQTEKVVGQIDAILGDGSCSMLDSDNLRDCLAELAALLENKGFVAKIGLERGKKKDPDDESKDAERYPDRNRITLFEHSDTWQAG